MKDLNNASPLISIIVPVYNVEKYIVKCIESIIKQSYANIEIILINDGSTDKSNEYCKCYNKKDDRIILVNKENGGLSDARNKGIDIAKGEYITFIDSDDYIDSLMIEKMVNRILIDKSDIVICNFHKVNKYGEILDKGRIEKDDVITGFEANQMMNINYSVSWGKLFKTDLFNGLRFPLKKQHEDEFLAHRLLGKDRKISIIKECMYNYLVRDDSIMNSVTTLNRAHVCEALLDRITYYNDLDMQKCISKTASQLLEVYIFLYYELHHEYKCELNAVKKEIILNLKKVSKYLSNRMVIELYIFSMSTSIYKHILNIKKIYRNGH